jgi:chemotaxis protein MotB
MKKEFISFQVEAEASDSAGNNRWMVSYADFMTLLFVLFLALYAKLPKHEQPAVPALSDPRAPIIAGIRPRHVVPAPAVAAAASDPVDSQQALLRELARTFNDLVQDGEITLVTRDQGILLEIKDSALFASGTAQPAQHAGEIADKIAAILADKDNRVVVEGHTDNVPIQTVQFPSNWELSSARAASIVRALQERGINPMRLEASGMADTKPKSSNLTVQGRSENRRVSLLVLNQ